MYNTRGLLILIIFILSYSDGQQSQCDSGYCNNEQKIFCDLGICCDNRCTDPRSPLLKTQDKGENCSSCQACKGNLCCDKGVCADACATDRGEYKCGCNTDDDCNLQWISGSTYVCVQNQCLQKARHMDTCVDDSQCSDGFKFGRLKCLDDPVTNKKRCMVGAKLDEPCENYGNRQDVCDPTPENEWSYCFNGTCTALPKEGEPCRGTYIKNYPCAHPWLTCIRGVCQEHFSAPLDADCNGPTQCELPLVCNSTEKTTFVEWQHGNGTCSLPSFDTPCKQTSGNCEREIQKCGCKDEIPVCLQKPVTNQCNSAYKALRLCASQTQCMPPFYSAFGWLERRGADSCLQEYCKQQLIEFYCCYSCDSLVLKGLKCYENPRTFDEPSCCAGDVACYASVAANTEQQRLYCQNASEVVVIIPPLAPIGGDTGNSGVDYNALITTIGLIIGLAIGGAFFGIYYWRKKAEYEQIRSWQDDSANPAATQMQPVGVSIGN